MYPKFSQSHLYFLYTKHTSLKRKKDNDEVRKTNCGDQRNCGNRLIFLIDVEMALKKRLKKEEEEELKKKKKK